jgi:TetR/AcrR family transcriptional regulator, transcriptional repressor for nem operon
MPIVKTSKEEVLLRATMVIRKRGYHKATMKEIADACAVQPSLFYYYFKSKEVLMEEVLQFSLAFFREKVLRHADNPDLSPLEKLDKMMQSVDRINKHLDGGCLMGNTALETAYMNADFLEVVRTFFEEFAVALTKVYTAKFPENEARALAEQVIQDVEGGVMLSVLYRDERFMQNAFRRAKGYAE